MERVNEIWKELSNNDSYSDLMELESTLSRRIKKLAEIYAQEKVEKLTISNDLSKSKKLSCPNTNCPIIRYDNGESYCTKCDYTD